MAHDTSGHRTRAENKGIRSAGKRTAFEPPDEGEPRPGGVGPPRGPTAALQKVPPWSWLVGGGSVVLVALSVALFALAAGSGFALVVRGAPRGAEVYVDGELKTGSVSPDGSIEVTGLQPGARRVLVACERYESWEERVTGEDGDSRNILPILRPLAALPAEIDYAGPMALVPAGAFPMGDDTHLPNERPVHTVAVADFYIDKYEVTNEQYRRFCEATNRPPPAAPVWNERYMEESPDAPVMGVTWDDAKAYAEWVGKRLPREDEWEKAASWDPVAKKKRVWPWGDSPETSRARANAEQPARVGQYPSGASPYGVFDMAGNALEWVDGTFDAYDARQGSDPQFGRGNRVARGGAFHKGLDELRTTRRVWHRGYFTAEEASTKTWVIGFRCAVSADDPRVKGATSK